MFILGAMLLIIIDQITKYLVVENINVHSEIPLIKNILSLTYIENTGAAWGVFSDKTWLLTVFAIIVVSIILTYVFIKKIKSSLFKTSIMLIVSGAIGNIIDRIFNDGKVIDMIYVKFINFPVFNFADCCVVVGAILLCIYVLFYQDSAKEVKNG